MDVSTYKSIRFELEMLTRESRQRQNNSSNENPFFSLFVSLFFPSSVYVCVSHNALFFPFSHFIFVVTQRIRFDGFHLFKYTTLLFPTLGSSF